MLTWIQLRGLIEGIVNSSPAAKKELGRRFASFLGLQPGPRGPDDGIDGWLEHNGLKIHFQSKLSADELDKDEARKYYADVKYHEPNATIMLAGVGFKTTFGERLSSYPDLRQVQVHLLTLRDLFLETEAYQSAAKLFPTLAGLGQVAMAQRSSDTQQA